MRASENRSDMEAELESEEPTDMCGDTSTSEDEGDRGIVVTSVECHEPTVASVSGGWDTKRHGGIPMSRKLTTSSDAVATPFGGTIGFTPPCSEHGGARWLVGGACPYPHVFGVGVCA